MQSYTVVVVSSSFQFLWLYSHFLVLLKPFCCFLPLKTPPEKNNGGEIPSTFVQKRHLQHLSRDDIPKAHRLVNGGRNLQNQSISGKTWRKIIPWFSRERMANGKFPPPPQKKNTMNLRTFQQTPGAYPKPPTNRLCFGIPFIWGWFGDVWGMRLSGYGLGFP